MKFIRTLGLLPSLLLVSPALADGGKAYPSLDSKQLGALRHIVEVANQLPDTYRFMEPGPRGGFDQYQFQIAFMDYTIDVAQSQLTPAYRELYQKASDNLIQKMMRDHTWEGLWLGVLSSPQFKPYQDVKEDLRDPVLRKNIMYSGHLLQMIGEYELLYRDTKYDKMGSIHFAVGGPGGLSHDYNFKSLAENLHQQFIDGGYVGIECEPNMVFAECNQHPVLGLMAYDAINGTSLSSVRDKFWDKAKELGYLSADTHRFGGPLMIKEKVVNKVPSTWNDGWTGMMLHGWNKADAELAYPAVRDASLKELIDTNPEAFKKRWAGNFASNDFGFLAAYAAEVGDHQTVKTMLDFADAHFNPQRTDGGYYYPRKDVLVAAPKSAGMEGMDMGTAARTPPTLSDDQLGQYLVGPTAGNALLAFARINQGDGLWNLYHQLSATYVAGGPELVDVRYPQVLVSQAFYDKDARRLALAIEPGTDYRGKTSMSVQNLSPEKVYSISMDGVVIASFDRGQVKPVGGADAKVAWNATTKKLAIECTLAKGRKFVVEERAGKTARL